MATPLNVEVLTEMGFEVPAEARPTTWSSRSGSPTTARWTPRWPAVDAALRGHRAAPGRRPQRGGTAADDGAARCGVRLGRAIALVSVPGPSAFVEAMDALEAGRDVMVFSDNVPVEQEVALKRSPPSAALLVMGPDCGTAVVGGVGLGFANVVAPGPGRHRRRLRHRLPAAARAARPRRRRGRRGARRRRPRPVRRGRRARHPRGAAAARRGPGRRADRAGLQAAGRRGGRGDRRRTPRRWPPRSSWRCSGRPARPHRRPPRRCCAALGHDGPDLAGRPARRRRRPSGRLPARALRRRHAGHEARLDRDRGASARTPATRSSTSATTRYTAGRAHPMIDPTLRLEHLARAAADPDDRGAPARRGPRPRRRARPGRPRWPRRSPRVRASRSSSPWSAPPPTRRASTARRGRWPRPAPRCTCPTPGATRRAGRAACR